MTSPTKAIHSEKDSTFFEQLSNVEKKALKLNQNMLQEFELIAQLKNDLGGIEKEAKQTSSESKVKLNDEIRQFEEKIKGFLIAQKAEYMRFGNQINHMIQNSKQIGAQLALLGSKYEQFEKNVGI